MSKIHAIVPCAVLCIVSSALAEIEEWGGAGGGYVINQALKQVRITAPGTYKFHSLLNGGGLDDINWIRVDAGVAGTVNVHVRRGPGPGELPVEGAQDVKEINLSNATIGNIAELRIAGDLGESNNIVAHNMTGTVTVGGDVLHMIDIDNDVTGAITIDGHLLANLECNSAGDITINGPGTSTGHITIIGAYDANMCLAGSCSGIIQTGDLSGAVDVDGNLLAFQGETITGTLRVGQDVGAVYVGYVDGGSVVIEGDMTDESHVFNDISETGTVTVAGQLTGHLDVWGDDEKKLHGDVSIGQVISPGYLSFGTYLEPTANVTINGPVTGDIWYEYDFGGSLEIAGDLAGVVQVYDSLRNSMGELVEITVAGEMTETGAIAVDWKGWDDQHDWDAGAQIKVGTTVYDEGSSVVNNPHDDPKLWHITECRGDLNNDDEVNGFDIDAFVTALGDEEQYAEDFPGLDGSRIYHGDCNCDGYFNGLDIEAFIENVNTGDCPGCVDSGFVGGGSGPQATADLLETYIQPTRLSVAITAIDEVIAYHGSNSDAGEFWSAVRTALLE